MVGVADSISAQRTTRIRAGLPALLSSNAQIAQLVRAPSSHGGGPAFESLFEHQIIRSRSAPFFVRKKGNSPWGYAHYAPHGLLICVEILWTNITLLRIQGFLHELMWITTPVPFLLQGEQPPGLFSWQCGPASYQATWKELRRPARRA